MQDRKSILIFILSFIIMAVQAQDFDLDEFSGNMNAAKGPNAQKFGHFFMGFGLLVDQPEGEREIKYLSSNNIDLGYRYKYKMGNVFAAGWELSYARLKFSFDPLEQDNLLGIGQTAEKEFLRLHQLKPGVYLRLNFDPGRGNVMGKFLDIGGYVTYNFGRNYYLEYEDGVENAKTRKEIVSGLNQVEPFSYGVTARLGINKLVLFTQYRLADLVNDDDFVTDEPSRILVGIQMGIHK